MSDAANPYQPPTAELGGGPEPGAGAALPDAGLGARLLNFVIDTVAVLVLGSIGVAILLLAGQEAVTSELWSNVLAFGVMILYYVIFETAFGWTLGKLVTGTRVTRIAGVRPGLLQVIARTAARFIPLEPLSLVMGGSAWHDGLGRTRVVSVRRRRPPAPGAE